jgi:cytidine deaminase
MSDEEIRRLVEAARAARKNAYAPYSGYSVGAAILAASGRMYGGANVENAAYPSGLCAERVALFSAVAAGERAFRALAVVTRDGGSPCGACRQALAEFGGGLNVIVADEGGRVLEILRLEDLLPRAFGAENLET